MKRYNLKNIVKAYMFESLGAEQVDKRFNRFLQIGISGVKEIANFSKQYKKTLELDISDNDVIYLPSDFIDYVQIGVCYGGQIWGLGRNQNLCMPSKDSCGNLKAPNVGFNNYDDIFHLFDSSVEAVENRDFGSGGGKNGIGYYKFNRQDGYVSISLTGYSLSDGDVPTIVMEYYADPDMIDGDFVLNPYEVEPLKAWIYWKSIQRLRSYSSSEKELAKREFNRCVTIMQKRNIRFNVRELQSASSRGFISAPKI